MILRRLNWRNWPGISTVHELKRYGRTDLGGFEYVEGIMDPVGLDAAAYEDVFCELLSEIEWIKPNIFNNALEKYREK